jgi:DNA-directed RNA polymerase specialized sigma24 family protein
MIGIDRFFRDHYRAMCGYCTSMGFKPEDVEEEVVDVMLKYFGDYISRCADPRIVRRWMNRRVMLDLRSKYANRRRHSMEFATDVLPDHAHSDTPEALLSLKQRVPETLHPILVNYEQYGNAVGGVGTNTSADKTQFCRQRKKLLAGLAAGQ